MAVCAQLRISAQLLGHAQIPELRAMVQIRVLLAGSPRGTLVAAPSPAPTVILFALHCCAQVQAPLCGHLRALSQLPPSQRALLMLGNSAHNPLSALVPVRAGVAVFVIYLLPGHGPELRGWTCCARQSALPEWLQTARGRIQEL